VAPAHRPSAIGQSEVVYGEGHAGGDLEEAYGVAAADSHIESVRIQDGISTNRDRVAQGDGAAGCELDGAAAPRRANAGQEGGHDQQNDGRIPASSRTLAADRRFR
jgi:hypothetical protein